MEVPVYFFTGFLEAGKTSFIQESLGDEFFNDGTTTLLLVCEEGIEEYEPEECATDNVHIEVVEKEKHLTKQWLKYLEQKYKVRRVLVEYNGMWELGSFINNLPDNWLFYQSVMMADATTFMNYNANMRNLVVDKLTSADLVLFNRCDDDTDYDALHKLVRGVTRRPDIIYENVNGQAAYDDIEDPLPFDVDAPVIEVGDSDYALFYRDMAENLDTYDGKTVSFLGQISSMPNVPADGFVIGRPVMTCCVEDIAFSGLLCENGAGKVAGTEWARVKGKITVKDCELYGRRGPVMRLIDAKPAEAPENPVSTFY